jgi:hypothetical protein
MNSLEQEIATYHRYLPEWIGQQGKFVLIKGTDIAGTFDSYQDALTAGYQRFKLDSFLVKQITPVERILFSRDLNTSRQAQASRTQRRNAGAGTLKT